jgi:hypothetical protein
MKGVKHYLKDGTEHKGATHKHKDGKLMTGAAMSKSSKTLVHYKDLGKTAKARTDGKSKKSKKPK